MYCVTHTHTHTHLLHSLTKKQMAYLLARQMVHVDVADEQLSQILANGHLSEQFLGLARELEVVEAKTPEDIYKSHLENVRMSGWWQTPVALRVSSHSYSHLIHSFKIKALDFCRPLSIRLARTWHRHSSTLLSMLALARTNS